MQGSPNAATSAPRVHDPPEFLFEIVASHNLMDAAAYLKSHGWRGLGYSLDKADRGISRPLLISHKNDALGVGKQKTLVADQWWMRAFDEGLKNIGTGKEVRPI